MLAHLSEATLFSITSNRSRLYTLNNPCYMKSLPLCHMNKSNSLCLEKLRGLFLLLSDEEKMNI